MKLWKKGATAHQKVDLFTVGKDREYDLYLAEYDCQASIAHAKMLSKIGVLTSKESDQLVGVLNDLKNEAEKYSKDFSDVSPKINIAHKLKNLHFENKDSFFRSSSKVVYDQSPDVSDFLNEVTLFDISKIFKDAVDNAPTQDTFEIYREIVSLKEQKNFILQQFKTNKIVSLKKLVKKLETKIEIIVTFLALLEMIKQSEIICSQKENFKDIEIKLIIAEA